MLHQYNEGKGAVTKDFLKHKKYASKSLKEEYQKEYKKPGQKKPGEQEEPQQQYKKAA